jgi:hypothetical protein
MLVVVSSKIASHLVVMGMFGHVPFLGEEPVLTQTQAPPPKMSVTDTGSSPKKLVLLLYMDFIALFRVFRPAP